MKNKPYYEKKAENNVKVEEGFLVYEIPPHFHRTVELQYILKENYCVTVRDETIQVKKDEILLISSQTVHSAVRQENVKTIMLLIPYDYFSYFPAFQNEANSFFIFNDKAFNRKVMLPILRLLVQNFDYRGQRGPLLHDRQICTGWVNMVFGNLLSFYPLFFDEKKPSQSTFYESILNYIDKNYGDSALSLQSIAKNFGYNSSYLSRAFKKGFSVSLSQHIRSVRVQKFLSLYPTQRDVNILNLAMSCGFSSLSAFYRAFHDTMNCAPNEYFFRVQQGKQKEEKDKSKN